MKSTLQISVPAEAAELAASLATDAQKYQEGYEPKELDIDSEHLWYILQLDADGNFAEEYDFGCIGSSAEDDGRFCIEISEGYCGFGAEDVEMIARILHVVSQVHRISMAFDWNGDYFVITPARMYQLNPYRWQVLMMNPWFRWPFGWLVNWLVGAK